MFSPSKLERYKVSNDELTRLGKTFYSDALPLFEKLFSTTFWIILDKTSSAKIIKQVFSEAIEYCNVTKNQADWQSWIYRIWMREINDYFEKRENDIQTNFEFIDYADITSYDNFLRLINETDIKLLLKKLPAVLRIPLIMKEVLQFNYEKISEFIDVPYGVVASRIYRARKLLFLLNDNKFKYAEEEQNWINKKSTNKIFEVRKAALFSDEELNPVMKVEILNSASANPQLESEIKLQSEIKSLVQNSLPIALQDSRLKSKIQRKAKKKFGPI